MYTHTQTHKPLCKVQRVFPKIRSSYSQLHSQCVCFGLFGSRTPAVSRQSLARQYSTQSYCLLSAYPTLSCTLSGRSYNWLLITLQPTRMLNGARESAWRDMASNQRCFILIQFEPFHMHAMQFTSLHTHTHLLIFNQCNFSSYFVMV